MNVAQQAQINAVRNGAVTYLAASVETSLYRNGKVLVRRNSDGNDTPWEGTERDKRQVLIHDARGLTGPERRTLEANGFEMLERPLAAPDLDFLDHEQVVSRYYPHCADIVRAHTGARIVKAFDHNVRSATGKLSGAPHRGRAAGAASRARGAWRLHADQWAAAPARDLASPPTVNDTYRTQLADGETLLDEGDVACALDSGRFALVNLWRNIADEPVATNPLALCDAASVHPDDLVVFEIHYADRIGRELLREARRRASLVFLPRAHPRRGAADQAVGFGGRPRALPRALPRTR